QPNEMIENAEEAMQQILMMVQQQKVKTVSGKEIAIIAETICIHGDGKNAVEFAKAINNILQT
ncbi:MAG: LamB/YcsF family protein, partial [Ginsengibacter sp.]